MWIIWSFTFLVKKQGVKICILGFLKNVSQNGPFHTTYFYHTKSNFDLCSELLIYFYNFLCYLQFLYVREKKMSQVGTVILSSCPDSEFIIVDDDSINFFSEFSWFVKINSKPLIDSPIFSKYLSGNGHSRLTW